MASGSSAASREGDYPPLLPPVALGGLTIVSLGVFLWIWALMWANWIRRKDPATKVAGLAWANIVPGALFYINLPSLLVATRQNDAAAVARTDIALVLWGSIALVMLLVTGVSIFVSARRLQMGMPTRHKP